MKIRILGAHNSEGERLKFVSILIDGKLALDAGGLTSSLSLTAQHGLKAVLLTHQHYDHIRDVPALAMNLYLSEKSIRVYSTSQVYDVLKNHLLNGKLYPDFFERPHDNPTIRFVVVEPLKAEKVEGYDILPVPVAHAVPSIGYQVTSPGGKAVFYTGDTGPGLSNYWRLLSPQLFITEVTAPDGYEEFGRETGHFTPSLLKQELITFQQIKGYLPQVVLVHMNPQLEEEIKAGVALAAQDLDCTIALGYEGMQLEL